MTSQVGVLRDPDPLLELRGHIDASLERERLFREDFSARLMAQMRQHLDDRLAHWFGLRMPLVMPAGARIYTHTTDGHRVLLDPSEPFITLHVLEHGQWEAPVRAVLRAILRPGFCFVDVGANIGLHTLLAASLVAPGGRVLALEPHPLTGSLLRDNLEINGLLNRVNLIAAAAAEAHGGTRRFEYFPQHSAMSGFRLAPTRVAEFQGTPQAVEVPLVTLDTLLAEHNLVPDLVKIDVEGFELRVLEGAQALLAADRDIAFLIEHDPAVTASVLGATAPAGVVGHFARHDFIVFQVADIGCLPLNIDAARDARGDLLFLRPRSTAIDRIFSAA